MLNSTQIERKTAAEFYLEPWHWFFSYWAPLYMITETVSVLPKNIVLDDEHMHEWYNFIHSLRDWDIA